ncbi:MAG: DUF5979 domain-containing protein [Lacrimispora saccharolytica]
MTGKIKKRGAAALACLLVVSAAGISSVYGAPGVEPDRSCSLSFELDGQYQELNEIAIPVNLYKVADVEVTGEYTSLAGYEELEFGSVSDSTTADEWENFAREASELTETLGSEPEVTLEIVPDEEGVPSARAENLSTGMYLVEAENVQTAEYTYAFTPYLVSLPSHYFYTTGQDEWVYDVTAGMKPQQNPRYGSLVIRKTLTSYNATLGSATFIFQVEGVKDQETVLSDVVSLVFDGTGTKSLEISGIPAGTEVTVTEVYGSANYDPVSPETERVTILADGEEGSPVTVEFVNEYNGKLNPGSGIVNHFEYDGGVWNWQRQADNSGGINLQQAKDTAQPEQE